MSGATPTALSRNSLRADPVYRRAAGGALAFLAVSLLVS